MIMVVISSKWITKKKHVSSQLYPKYISISNDVEWVHKKTYIYISIGQLYTFAIFASALENKYVLKNETYNETKKRESFKLHHNKKYVTIIWNFN